MTLQEIIAYLREHANEAEVKAAIADLSKPDRATLERVLLETDDGRAVFNSLYDKRHKKFEEEKLPELVRQKLEDEKRKSSPSQGAQTDPVVQQLLDALKAQQERLDKIEKGSAKNSRLEKVHGIFAAKKVPEKFKSFAERLIADNDDETERLATEFADGIATGLEATAKAILGESGYTPPASAPPSDDDKLSDREYYRKQDQLKKNSQ